MKNSTGNLPVQLRFPFQHCSLPLSKSQLLYTRMPSLANRLSCSTIWNTLLSADRLSQFTFLLPRKSVVLLKRDIKLLSQSKFHTYVLILFLFVSLFNLSFKAFAEYLQTTDIRLLCNDSDHFPILLNEDVMFALLHLFDSTVITPLTSPLTVNKVNKVNRQPPFRKQQSKS